MRYLWAALAAAGVIGALLGRRLRRKTGKRKSSSDIYPFW